MALINVRRIIIEEVNETTNQVVQNGKRFVVDCNETVNIEEFYLTGEEKYYTNDRQTVAYNLTPNINYGYDINISFSNFDLSLYAYLSNNIYVGDGYDQKNLFGNGAASYGNLSIEYRQTSTYLRNARIWGIEHIRPADYNTGNINIADPSYYGILTTAAQGSKDYIGLWSTYYGVTSSTIRGTNELRKYITFDNQRQEDTSFMDYLYRLRNDIESRVIVSDNERYYYYLTGSSPIYYYRLQVPGIGGLNATSSYILEATTTTPINNLVGYYQFGVMQSYSVMAMQGLRTTTTRTWRPKSVIGLTYNFFCVLESSNLGVPFNFDSTQTDSYDIARFYYEMRRLPSTFNADFILRNTYMYITLNTQARELIANLGDTNSRGSTIYTQNATYAAENRATIMNFANADKSKILFDSLYNLRTFFVGNSATLDPDHNNKSWTLRRQVTFDVEDDIKLTSYIIFMPTSNAASPWVPPTDTTPPVLRMGIPFKSPTFYTLVPANVPIDSQNFAMTAYTRDEQDQYNRDMQYFIDNEADINLGVNSMKSVHSSERTFTNLFKTTLYAENYEGTDRKNYCKMEFPLCHADPPAIDIANDQFSQLEGTIHAREDFINYQSSIYVNQVDDLET